jgi:hypothetical protein
VDVVLGAVDRKAFGLLVADDAGNIRVEIWFDVWLD